MAATTKVQQKTQPRWRLILRMTLCANDLLEGSFFPSPGSYNYAQVLQFSPTVTLD